MNTQTVSSNFDHTCARLQVMLNRQTLEQDNQLPLIEDSVKEYSYTILATMDDGKAEETDYCLATVQAYNRYETLAMLYDNVTMRKLTIYNSNKMSYQLLETTDKTLLGID